MIVSNTSPLLNLAVIDRLDMLRQVFGRIVIPPAVFHEMVVTGAGKPGSNELPTVSWIDRQSVVDRQMVHSLNSFLHTGESEAIALAIQMKARTLIIDDARGRRAAEKRGVHTIGLLGVLLKAKQAGHISAVKPLMDQLMEEAEFRVAPRLYEHVLLHARET